MNHKPTIAFFGSSLVSAYWNGAATYYRGLVRALHARGYRVTFYEPDAYERQQHRDMPDPPWARVVVYSAQGTDALEACLQEAAGADLIVKASGVGVFDELLEARVPALRRSGNLVAFWDVDAPATLERLRRNPQDPFHPLIPRYDLIFTYGGGQPVISAYEQLGARRCVPIYNALDPQTHHPVPPEPRFEADLGFLGNRLPDREARVEAFFIQAAAMLPQRQFLLGGSGWEDKPLPPNIRRLGHVPTADHNAFNCTPRAVLNISRQSMADFGFSPATRVFEAAGAAACLITDDFPGIDEFFEPETEILVARDGADVARQLEALTPAKATAIGQAACRRVLADHTYAQRAVRFEEAIGADPGSGISGAGIRDSHSNPNPGTQNPKSESLNIVILGLSITSSWGNGHATTYRGLVRELSRRGHQVLFLERDKPWYANNRDLPHPPFGRTALYKTVEDLKRRFAAEVRQADLVIVGSYVPQGVAVGQWVIQTARGLPAFYDIDTPVTLAKLERGDEEYLSRALVPRYRLYLSFTGGPTLERLEREFGSPAARALYCAVDPESYYPQESAKIWELGYLGTYSPDRQPALEQFLMGTARRRPAGRFVVAGSQYPSEIDWPPNVQRIEHLNPSEHRAFYNQQDLTLNLTRSDMRRAGYCPSVRLFEAAACGVPILTDRWEGLDEFFTPNEEICVIGNTEEALRLMEQRQSKAMRLLGQAARHRVLSRHTAAHRAAELETIVHELNQ